MSYKPASQKCKLLGKPCLIACYPNSAEGDYVIAGKYGAIWKYSKTQFFVLITGRAYNRHIAKPKRLEKLSADEEHGFVASYAEAKAWLLKLKIPRTRKTQLKYWEALHGKGSEA